MNELIKVSTNEQGLPVISARELYDFLEVTERFNSWCERMFEYGFELDKDYTPLTFLHPQNKQELDDYALLIDCAKEIAMIQRTDQGKRARQYFIECEKQLNQTIVQKSPTQLSRKELAMLVIQAEEEKERLESQLAIAQPKAEFYDEVLDTDDCWPITVVAKEFGYSAMKFNLILKDKGVQWKVGGAWVLTTKYADKGYTQMRTKIYHDTKGLPHTTMYTVWTQRGRAMLHQIFKNQ